MKRVPEASKAIKAMTNRRFLKLGKLVLDSRDKGESTYSVEHVKMLINEATRRLGKKPQWGKDGMPFDEYAAQRDVIRQARIERGLQ